MRGRNSAGTEMQARHHPQLHITDSPLLATGADQHRFNRPI